MTREKEITITMKTDRRLISTKGGKRHLLIDLHAPEIERRDDEPRIPLNLALVVDASGSMQGQPLEAVKQAACGVIEALAEGDRLTVVSFASDVVTHVDALAIDGASRATATATVQQLDTRGSTNLAAGWFRGCERVAAWADRQPGMQNRVILLSDGHANEGLTDPETLALHAAGQRLRKLFTTTVGVGDGYSATLLQALAEHGGGRMHHASDSADIVEVVLGELGEILRTVADDVALTIEHPLQVAVGVLGNSPLQVEPGRTTVTLGTLVSGARRRTVLQLAIAAGEERERLAFRATPAWAEPDGSGLRLGTAVSVEMAPVPIPEVAAELPDLPTCTEVARLWKNHILLKTTSLNEEGRCAEALQYLDEVIDEFRQYCRDLPEGRDLMRELDRHRQFVGAPMAAGMVKDVMCCSAKYLRCEEDLRTGHRSDRRCRPDSI